jgi:hypothetical protein
MGVNGIFVKQFFPKNIVEKNSAIALFQNIYGILNLLMAAANFVCGKLPHLRV